MRRVASAIPSDFKILPLGAADDLDAFEGEIPEEARQRQTGPVDRAFLDFA